MQQVKTFFGDMSHLMLVNGTHGRMKTLEKIYFDIESCDEDNGVATVETRVAMPFWLL